MLLASGKHMLQVHAIMRDICDVRLNIRTLYHAFSVCFYGAAFQMFDEDNSGRIDEDQLFFLLQYLGLDVSGFYYPLMSVCVVSLFVYTLSSCLPRIYNQQGAICPRMPLVSTALVEHKPHSPVSGVSTLRFTHTSHPSRQASAPSHYCM